MRAGPSLPLWEEAALDRLRDGALAADKPVLLFSGGKASTVLAGLAVKAFAPARPPMPLLYIDSPWAFREARDFVCRFAVSHGFELVLHQDGSDGREARVPGVGRPRLGDDAAAAALHESLEFAGYDVAFDGAIDETASLGADRLRHPLAGWSERNLWSVIARERLPVCPLYFSASRPVARRGDMLVIADAPDWAGTLGLGPIRRERVRLESLGRWPVTPAIRSKAGDLSSVLREMARAMS